MNINENNGLLLNNKYYIPPEVLSLILSNVDGESLYKHCVLVCNAWNEIIKEFVWKIKCEKQLNNDKSELNKLKVLKQRQKQYGYRVYQMISVKNIFYKNLIRNPCGVEGLEYWKAYKNDGDEFLVEDCTTFDDNYVKVPNEMLLENITRCFTTSYQMCSKVQIIDLFDEGFSPEFLDKYQPPIYIKEWYGSRRDCGCFYEIFVVFYDTDLKPIKRCSCTFIYKYQVDQWKGGDFKKIEFIFKNYGTNLRYVLFNHCGRDTQFWAGHYGSKFTNSTLEIYLPDDERTVETKLEQEQDYHRKCTDPDYCYSYFDKFDGLFQ